MLMVAGMSLHCIRRYAAVSRKVYLMEMPKYRT